MRTAELTVLKLSSRNRHKVPKKQWAKWRPEARVVFNETFATMRDNQACFLHPATDELPTAQWKTICWNAAWIAADAAS